MPPLWSGRAPARARSRLVLASIAILATFALAAPHRVRFYVRPGVHGTATTLLEVFTLTARHFASPPGRASVPRC